MKPLLAALASMSVLSLASLPAFPGNPGDDYALANERDGTDWVAYGRTFSANHFSPLRQINAGNVARLKLAWYRDIDVRPTAFSAPLAVGGVLYYSAGYSVIHAVDARTGRLLWRYDPHATEVAGKRMRGAWGLRGLAWSAGQIFFGTIDGRLIALDAKTGNLRWSVMTLESGDGRYITGPPCVFNHTVVIGNAGDDFVAVRGYVTAYDSHTGKKLWRFFTVPGDPANGFENKTMEMAARTWTGDVWKAGGGGSVWNAMAYDRKLNRLYIGVGNGFPWNYRIRSAGQGDNLFLDSIVALDADSGDYIWHYQLVPGDTWDYDASLDIELARIKVRGKRQDVLLHAGKNGFFYVLDRRDGRLLSADKYVPSVNWADHIDLQSGRPIESVGARFPNGSAAVVIPSPLGAHNANAMAYNPETGFAYVPAIEQAMVYTDPAGPLKDWKPTPGQVLNPGLGSPPAALKLPPESNYLLAWDPGHQRTAWKVDLPGKVNGSIMTTAGNLVFQGNVRGEVAAYAADTGQRLWSFDAQNGVLSEPITFLAGGKQYVAVLAGNRMIESSGRGLDWDYVMQKRRVLTFVLDGEAFLPASDIASPRPFVDDPAFNLDDAKAGEGASVYGQHCILCHGPAAQSGGMAPDLRKSSVVLYQSGLTAVVKEGALLVNGMPRFEELSDAQIVGLQHYIRQQARVALTGQRQEGLK